MDSTRGRGTTPRGFSDEVPTPKILDPLAGPHQELRGHSTHRSRPGVGSHKTLSELCLQSHCQAFRRYASTPSSSVSCWSDSRPFSRAQLEASSRSSEQPMDRPAPQGQQWHTTSWRVEKIHHVCVCTGVMLRPLMTTRWRRRRVFTRAGFKGEGRPPTNRGLPPNPPNFWLMIYVSLVILIKDFEINEKTDSILVGYQPIRAQTKRIGRTGTSISQNLKCKRW